MNQKGPEDEEQLQEQEERNGLPDFSKILGLPESFDPESDFDSESDEQSNDITYHFNAGISMLKDSLEKKVEETDYDDIIRHFDKIIEIKPNQADIYCLRGFAKQMNSNLDGAINDFTEAINFCPDYAEAYFFRGAVKTQKNEFDAAIEDFVKANEL